MDNLNRFYLAQKGGAKARGIGWELTFEEWRRIWEDSGKLDLRGRGRDQYCMSRIGDCGPYAAWNVRIVTNRENVLESLTCMARNEHRLERRSLSVSRDVGYLDDICGWTSRRGEDPLDILMREEG